MKGNADNRKENSVRLTEIDRAILESYKNFCEGMSDYLGAGYEIVLHSLENLDQSVIKIINGYYTGRKEGSPITDLALHMLEEMRERNDDGYISYFTKNKSGAPMRSCTIAIAGENGRTIGLMCINLYLDTPFSKFMGNFFSNENQSENRHSSENFVDDSSELIKEAVFQIQSEVLADSSILVQNRNKEIVQRLSTRGIFRLKDSVVRCAEILGISRNTVYMHLRNSGGDCASAK